MNKSKVKHLTLAALMGAMAFVLMYFSFSVPVISPFAEFDLSAIPELIGGFVFELDGCRLDASVRTKLKKISDELIDTASRIV